MTQRAWIRQLPLHLMVWSGLVFIIVYSYGSMAGIVIAFQKFIPAKGFFDSPWVGFDNFQYIYQKADTGRVIYNTVFIAVMKLILGLVAPIAIALLLNEVRLQFFKRSVQTLIYLPHFLSWVILSGILIDILSPSYGIVNQVMTWFGLHEIFFLGNDKWFPYIMIVSDIWKEAGFGTIVFLAALTGINPVLYEAAVIDGAGRWRQTWHITLPGMIPIIVLIATLSLGKILNAGFDQIFNMYSPVVYSTGDIIDTYVYRLGIEDFQYGIATALGLFKSVISFFLISVSYVLAYRFANYRIF